MRALAPPFYHDSHRKAGYPYGGYERLTPSCLPELRLDWVEHDDQNAEFAEELANHLPDRLSVWRMFVSGCPPDAETQHSLGVPDASAFASGTEYDGYIRTSCAVLFHNLCSQINIDNKYTSKTPK